MFNKKLIPAVVSGILIIVLVTMTILTPKKTYSEEQNKSLPSFPTATLEKIFNKNYMNSLEKYLSEHIFGKDFFVKINNNFKVMLGKNEFNNVLVSKNRLVEVVNTSNNIVGQNNAKAILNIFENNKYYENFRFALVPTALEIYDDEFSNSPLESGQIDFITKIYSLFQLTQTIDMHTSLISQKNDPTLYYYSDSSWTSHGAFNGYSSLAKGLNFINADKNMFNVYFTNQDFYGNLYNKTLIKPDNRDTIDMYKYSAEEITSQTSYEINGVTKTSTSIFFTEYLHTSQKQRVFLGEDFSKMTINTSVQNGKKILIFKDSYTNPLIQFLQLHYQQITLIDLKYADEEILNQINFNDYSSVLFLYNVGNFVQDTSISNKLSLIK